MCSYPTVGSHNNGCTLIFCWFYEQFENHSCSSYHIVIHISINDRCVNDEQKVIEFFEYKICIELLSIYLLLIQCLCNKKCTMIVAVHMNNMACTAFGCNQHWMQFSITALIQYLTLLLHFICIHMYVGFNCKSPGPFEMNGRSKVVTDVGWKTDLWQNSFTLYVYTCTLDLTANLQGHLKWMEGQRWLCGLKDRSLAEFVHFICIHMCVGFNRKSPGPLEMNGRLN